MRSQLIEAAYNEIFGAKKSAPDLDAVAALLEQAVKEFDPNQPRDENGMWTGGGGGGSSSGGDGGSPVFGDAGSSYFSTDSFTESDDFGRRQFEQVYNNLTQEEKDALIFYKEDGYKDINVMLREGNSSGGEIGYIDSVMAKSIISEPCVVYRGWDADGMEQEDLTGGVMTDGAYISTALNYGAADRFSNNAMAEIRIPAGTRGFYLDLVGGRDPESEILIDRGYNYRVISDSYSDDPGGYRLVVLEIIP